MKEKIVRVRTADGFKLKTIASIPKKPNKIVIMCHGINSHKQEYLNMFPNLAEELFNKGVGSVRFDFRGHGQSSGKDLDFDFISQLIDLDTIINWTRSKWKFDAKVRFSFVGVSFGSAPGIVYQSINRVFNFLLSHICKSYDRMGQK
jgi:uncharacterized protein